MSRLRDDYRFTLLLIAIAILLIGYPYFRDDSVGAFMGGMTSLLLCCAGVYAVHPTRWRFIVSGILALVAAGSLTVIGFIQQGRGHPLVESAFFLFYAFTTVSIFLEVIQTKDVKRDTIIGAICVYLMVGLTFGSLYDFVETMAPGSFQANISFEGETDLGFRRLLYFSFMTLTAVGYGDIVPTTEQAQSLVIIEGVMGVMYLAVLVARFVGIYSSRS